MKMSGSLLLAAFSLAAWGQGGRPEAGPFDASRIEMQPPPAQGVVIRAGRLFDPKSGTNLQNQVIVVQGDRITEVGPAAKVSVPGCDRGGPRVPDNGR